jgi:hypothetical protein
MQFIQAFACRVVVGISDGLSRAALVGLFNVFPAVKGGDFRYPNSAETKFA